LIFFNEYYIILQRDIMKPLVIIPTYNEADNIERLINTLLGLKLNLDVLVVDDNSPDGTSGIVKQKFAGNRNVSLITRDKKDGRGGAVVEGIRYALGRVIYDRIIEMDADFSHDPKDIPVFLAKAKEADVVIGSRYIPGSSTVNWPFSRKVFSKFSNIYAKLMLGVPIHDYTNGYRCYSLDVAKSIDSEKIISKGYIALSEIAYKLHRKGFTFTEIPVVFVNRKRGVSNLNFGEIFQAFRNIWAFRFGR
jgi:dolichol-phosphate mannosyltransferase